MIWSWIVLVTRSWSSCWQTFRSVLRNDDTAYTTNWTIARRKTAATTSTSHGPKGTVRGSAGLALTWIARTTASIRSFATYAVIAGMMPATIVAVARPTVSQWLAAQTSPRTRGTAPAVARTAWRARSIRPRRSVGPSSGGSGMSGSPVSP